MANNSTTTDASTDTTAYLKKRLIELGITDELNTYTRVWYQDTDHKDSEGKIVTTKNEQRRDYKIFDADEYGNINIHYFNLEGQPYRWKKEDTKLSRDFIRKRIRDPKSDNKYMQDKGSGLFPFFNPGIIDKYKKNKDAVNIDGSAVAPIETLFVVEGEFKSFKGYLAGIDIIGIPSIHGFYNGDVRGKLHEDIQELIIVCRVEKIVFLVDADLLTLKWEEKKDLAKRPESFYSAVKLFRESLQLLLDDKSIKLDQVLFMHLQTKFTNDAKGLDDLLAKYSSVTDDILEDIRKLQFAKKYFVGTPLTDANKDLQYLRKYLGLTDEQEFYRCYADFIGSREFLYRNKRYEYNSETRQVVFVRHEDANKYMRIGADWFKVIKKLDKHGLEYEELKVWPISEITRDYKLGRSADFFIDQLVRYDDFINEPSWNGVYKRTINNCYNLCYPLRWDKHEGPIDNTLKFIKHIFGGQATAENDIHGDPFTIALDWLNIFHRDPKHSLPVIVLVSKENETGKSTFMKWLRTIYGPNNAVILSNEEFKMRFNSHYISKALIMVDEGFLDAEKKSEKERLKKLVTSDTAYIEFKGTDLKLINYYSKIIINSNDDEKVMKMEEEENRWFVIKVPKVAEKDPDLEKKMAAEIPAWIHFLANRSIFHPRKTRLWFDSSLIITDQFKKIVEATKNRLDRVFEDWIREQFRMYRLGRIMYSLTFLTQVLNDFNNNKYKVDKIELRTYLQKRGVESEKRAQRFKSPDGVHMPINPKDPKDKPRVLFREIDPTFPYIFEIERWLTAAEIEDLLPLADPQTGELNLPESSNDLSSEAITANQSFSDELPF